jgi:PAS domain S-box-containing protein
MIVFSRLKHLTQSYRFAIFQTVLFGLLITIGMTLFINAWVNDTIEAEKSQQRANLVRMLTLVQSSIEPDMQEIRQGKIDPAAGIQLIRHHIRQMTFSDENGPNYIFMGKYDGTLLVQPFQVELEGTNQWDLQDANGVYIVRQVIQAAQSSPNGGFVTYIYPIPGSNLPQEKISYVIGVPELQVFIGVGIYMEKYYQQQTALVQRTWYFLTAFIVIMLMTILLTINRLKRQNDILKKEINERKNAQQFVEASEHSLRAVFNSAYDAIFIHDFDGKIIEVNQRMLEMYGVNHEQAMRMQISDLHPQGLVYSESAKQMWKRVSAGETFIFETKSIRQDTREEFKVEAGLRPVVWYNNKVIMAVVRDITARKKAEESFHSSEARFHAAVNNIPFDLFIFDPHTKQISFQNATSVKNWGQAETVSLFDADPEAWQNMDETIEHGLVFREETSIVKDNKRREIYRIIAPVYSAGEVDQAIGINIDITERKLAEEKVFYEIGKLNSLRQIDLQVIDRSPIDRVFQTILDQIVNVLKVDAVNILLLDLASNQLIQAAHYGTDNDLAHCTHPITQGCLPWKVINQRKIIIAKRQGVPYSMCDCFTNRGFSSFYGAPIITNGNVMGVIEVYHRQTDPEVDQEWIDYLETLAGQTAIAIDNNKLFSDLQKSNDELYQAYEATIQGWSKALELRDEETQGHSERVVHLACELAEQMGISGEEMTHFRRGVLLHDIGKMGIPDNILLKPGPLTDEEWFIMRQHPALAYHLLSNITYLRPSLEIPYCHHERWNGSGYPRGLAGEAIPLSARIFAVVDVWDALISDRPYRKGWSPEKIKEYIQQNSGIQFDPHVVEQFFNLPYIKNI